MQLKSIRIVLSFVGILIFYDAYVSATDGPECTCGYYDTKTQNFFTDATIVYFNETAVLPLATFEVESYSHKYEKGWNTPYREAAAVSNVALKNLSFDDSQSLELQLLPPQEDHLVVGASLKSLRRDIEYGSFRALMRSPAQWAGGSALSLGLQYNLSQMVTLNLQNADQPSAASVSMLEGEEFPDADLRVTYANMTDGSFGDGSISLWDYTEYQIDWTKEAITFYIGGHVARTINQKQDSNFFVTPSPLFLRHWSNGNKYSSQGPPEHPTTANVGWVRMFFNSSLMSESDHSSFDERCKVSQACSIDDMTLRASSPFPEHSRLVWKQEQEVRPTRWAAIWIAVCCITVSTSVLVGPIWKRVREKRSPDKGRALRSATGKGDLISIRGSQLFDSRSTVASDDRLLEEPKPPEPCLIGDDRKRLAIVASTDAKSEKREASWTSTDTYKSCTRSEDLRSDSTKEGRDPATKFDDDILDEEKSKDGNTALATPKRSSSAHDPDAIVPEGSNRRNRQSVITVKELADEASSAGSDDEPQPGPNLLSLSNRLSSRLSAHVGKADTTAAPVFVRPSIDEKHSLAQTPEALPGLPEKPRRIEHLAGLVTISALLVTAIHFVLTFIPAALDPSAFTHYDSEVIERKILSSFLLNAIWIGPFLMVSTRFLVSDYLRTGDLLRVADKTVRRTFRLMIPVTTIALLQYFFIQTGAIKWIQYLPSITWSTWPYVVGFPDFGVFLTEILELAYLIPNAGPKITYHYCTGVLWTIPVELQGSWTALLGAVVVREIKRPWKRFCFYTFCIINHWYALSWGAYFYTAIMLVDLEVTYKWRTYLRARPVTRYPLFIFCMLVAVAAIILDFITHWTNVNYTTFEHGIHPDPTTGLSISQAGLAEYPPYYVPRLNWLVFSAGLQAALELSPFLQKLFSLKPFVFLFPHIFTIYLIHGFVFWSLGSWLCITLAVHGLPYWANILVVAVCCYAAIALSLPVLTPLLDSLGGSATTMIWQHAREEPLKRRPTLYPFSKDFFLRRQESSV